MSESESPAQAQSQAQAHATTGGKSLAAAERPRYKSWRKKYRKMKQKFDGVLETNKTLFKEEQKLEGIARRLREELDGLLDLLLDLNQSPALPPDLRFNISIQEHTAVSSIQNVVPDDQTPEAANQLLLEYTLAVQRGQIPNLDLHVIRDQIDKKLAAQGVITLEQLEASVSQPRETTGALLHDLQSAEPPGYLGAEQEDSYLLRLDAQLGDPISFTKMNDKDKERETDHKHWAEMTAREVERQIELLNPQSQHNWLKHHATKTPHADIDDNESLASHDAKPTSGRGGGGKRNLAKQVGDRAVGRAREGASPSAASLAEDDDLAFVDDHPQSAGKKRARADPDGTYRVKGGKGGASAKGKRKRAGDETPTGSGKKAKVEAD